MTGANGIDFNELDPEIQISVHQFNEERTELYDWLSLKLRSNADVFTFNGETGEVVKQVARRFIESAVEIRQRVDEPDVAIFLISDSWACDEEDRNQRFSALAMGTDFQLLDRPWVESAVSDVLKENADDENAFISDLHSGYNDSLTCDVTKLLKVVHSIQERDIMAKLIDLPLSTVESSHHRASVPLLRHLSRAYAKAVPLGN